MYPKSKITLEKYLVNHTKTCYGLLNIVSRDFFVMLVGWHLLFKFLLGNQMQYILANLCFDLVCSTQIRRDNSCSGWTMKSFALLSLLIILVLVDFSSNRCRSLWFWQKTNGYSLCGWNEYFKGFYRDANQGKEDEIDFLRKASCCTAPRPYENRTPKCTKADFWKAFNQYVN